MTRGASRIRSIARELETWFETSQRDLPWRHGYDPWLVWVSETMLQQTRMAVVLPYFERFTRRFPTLASLAAADEEEVLALWSGLGYYRRARFLHAAARIVAERRSGVIPDTFEELIELPGMGRYTAGAVAAIAFGRRVPAVDGNVERIIARLEAIEHPSDTRPFRQCVDEMARALVDAAESPRVLNQAVMEVGALICTPTRPRCPECPVNRWCTARRAGEPARYPIRPPRRAKLRMRIPLYIVLDEAGRVLMLRSSGALLGGMYHLPHGSPDLDASLHVDLSRSGPQLLSFRHTITNRSIEFLVFEADAPDLSSTREAGDAMWVDPRDLDVLPHASYVRKALAAING